MFLPVRNPKKGIKGSKEEPKESEVMIDPVTDGLLPPFDLCSMKPKTWSWFRSVRGDQSFRKQIWFHPGTLPSC